MNPTTPMTPAARAAAIPASTPSTVQRAVFSRDEFAREFAATSRAMWCIAAAVIGDRSRAEDVVQEAALAAWQKIEEFEPGTSFLAWMGKFVRYTALNEARRRKMRAAAPLDGVDAPASRLGVQEDDPRSVTSRGTVSAEQTGFDDHVVSALNDLDETARACLLLRTVHDMAYRDISLVLDVPEGTAMSHVHRARKLMRDQLAEHYEQTSGRRSA
ncbi:MAG: RNA polymerase sigma factor [Pyrinomonadaceae bacterium]|nr:RNA polymerase sigma factor [Phycisphaerales bacterium]